MSAENLQETNTNLPIPEWQKKELEKRLQQAIESGLEDSKAGRTKDVNEIRKKYGL